MVIYRRICHPLPAVPFWISPTSASAPWGTFALGKQLARKRSCTCRRSSSFEPSSWQESERLLQTRLPAQLDECQITHLICACLKYDLYDFFRGCVGAFYTRKRTGSRPKTRLKKAYRSYFRRAQIRWVIWRSSNNLLGRTRTDWIPRPLCSKAQTAAASIRWFLRAPKPGCFKPSCLQFLRRSALLWSFAPFSALFALLRLRYFALIFALLCSFACFCVRLRSECPRLGISETWFARISCSSSVSMNVR